MSHFFEPGMVWHPDVSVVDDMIEEHLAFSNVEYDDLVDSMTQALTRYRQDKLVQLPTDDWEKGDGSAQVRAYY